MKTRRIAVFCGSAHGVDATFVDAARELGRLLAARGQELVYGGGGTGLMGELATSVLEAGGKVIGVMPHFMIEQEAGLTGLADMRIVRTMHERKAMMAELADAFVALPGGIGTLEEIFEVWTHTSLKLADKRCALLNTGGYYDHLLSFLRHAVDRRFVRDHVLADLLIAPTPAELLARITES